MYRICRDGYRDNSIDVFFFRLLCTDCLYLTQKISVYLCRTYMYCTMCAQCTHYKRIKAVWELVSQDLKHILNRSIVVKIISVYQNVLQIEFELVLIKFND